MRLRGKLSFILPLVALLFLFPSTASAQELTNISRQIICQCGCTLVLSNCTHHECSGREPMTAFINDQLAQGKSADQIVQLFVAQYGEQVLSSPPKRGFNLAAWVTPFMALLIGGVVISLGLKRWVRREPPARNDVAVEEDEGYRHRLEEELKEFDDRSFR
jgi:cytochrome c-type biogenesis protein CcmH